MAPFDSRALESPRAFDGWAETYDQNVSGREDFPFLGYDAALEGVVAAAAPNPPAPCWT